MSKLDELIQELCPDGVSFVKLEELCPVMRGKRLTKSQLSDDGQYVVYHGSKDTPLGFYDDYNVEGDTVIVVNTGGIGGVKYIKDNFWCSDGSFWIKHNDKINNKFLYYYLVKYEGYYLSQKRVGGVPTIDKSVVSNTCIPVPPLEVQCEIVRILDKFTLLTAELTAELTSRRKQYNYYTHKLFEDLEEEFIELDKIGEVTKLAGFEFSQYVKYSNQGNIIALRGLNVKSGRLILNDVKYIDSSDLSKLDRSKLYENDILYTYVGTVGQVGLIDKNDKYYLAPNVARIRIIDNKVLPKYVIYYLLTDEFKKKQLNVLTGTSSMKNITMSNIRKFKIPVVSIEKQRKIIDILDRFDKLCNDIISGIPAEIELNNKRYEYYRDKLLTFKEKK